MTDNKTCPSCGATLESNVGSQCPFCGAALATVSSSSAQTLISRPLSKKGEFENSAEAMDEVKRLVREGDANAAAQVASEQFDLKPEDAKSTVEQVEVDMKYAGDETKMAEQVILPAAAATPEPAFTPVTPPSQAAYTTPPAAISSEPPKSSNKNWIIGGSIGAAVFLCLCCCLPLLIGGLSMLRRGR